MAREFSVSGSRVAGSKRARASRPSEAQTRLRRALRVDADGRETPIPFRDLPVGYHGDVQVLKSFGGLPRDRQAAVCQAWAEAVRTRGGAVAEVRIYQTLTDVSRRVGDRGAPPARTLRYTCRPGGPDAGG